MRTPILLLPVASALAGCPAPELTSAEDVTALCADRSTELVQMTAFLPERVGCTWGSDGNLEEAQGDYTARVEEVENLIPPGEDLLICSLDFDFDGDWYFDDDFFLTWNGAVLATNQGRIVDEFSDWLRYPLWEWEDIAGLTIPSGGFGGGGAQPFCAGEDDGDADCSIPSADGPSNNGRPLDLEFEQAVVSELALRARVFDTLDIGLITTGDNDDEDCKHADFSLDLSAQVIRF